MDGVCTFGTIPLVLLRQVSSIKHSERVWKKKKMIWTQAGLSGAAGRGFTIYSPSRVSCLWGQNPIPLHSIPPSPFSTLGWAYSMYCELWCMWFHCWVWQWLTNLSDSSSTTGKTPLDCVEKRTERMNESKLEQKPGRLNCICENHCSDVQDMKVSGPLRAPDPACCPCPRTLCEHTRQQGGTFFQQSPCKAAERYGDVSRFYLWGGCVLLCPSPTYMIPPECLRHCFPASRVASLMAPFSL